MLPHCGHFFLVVHRLLHHLPFLLRWKTQGPESLESGVICAYSWLLDTLREEHIPSTLQEFKCRVACSSSCYWFIVLPPIKFRVIKITDNQDVRCPAFIYLVNQGIQFLIISLIATWASVYTAYNEFCIAV